MILPQKHLLLAESLIGLSGVLLSLIKVPLNVFDLWTKYEKMNNSHNFPANHSYDNFLLALDLLYAIGAIEINDFGEINASN